MSSATTSLSYRHIFGINGAITDNVNFADDDTIVYVAGHSVVLYNKIERKQKFIYGSEQSEGITSFAASPGKSYIAMAEKCDRHAQVNIFDLKSYRKRKTLTNTESSSKEYVSLQFSEDNQLLLALTGAPDWCLQCWHWSKAKVVASIAASDGSPMNKCSFSPTDASVACCSGKDYIKFFRISDREARLLQETHLEGVNFTSHIWLRTPEDHVVASTDSGDLMVFRSGDYICHLSEAPGMTTPIYCLLPLAQGFVAGSSAGTFLFFSNQFEGSDLDEKSFHMENMWSTEMTQSSVVSLALAPSEDFLCAVTADNQLLSLPSISPNTISTEDVKYVTCSFHGQKSIVGMDICYRKPLILTCSRDQSLRIWNFQSLEMELCKVFPEEMLCGALHPSGLHCAVGFGDKLRVFHILVDELRPALELPIKNCRECRFSSGGHMLAAANGNSINVFDFYTGEKVADLRGHNGKVRSIHWMDSGAHILSCGQDGAVYIWEIDGSKRTGEFVHKGTLYTSAVCAGTVQEGTVFVVGSDRMLKELEMPDLSLSKELDGGGALMNLVALSISKSVLFTSTADPGKPGVIRAYSYPVTGDYLEYTCMSSPVTRLSLSPDQSCVVATDEQGCVCIFELKDRSERYQRGGAEKSDVIGFADWVDEALVTRAELEDRNQTVLELKTKVDELKLHNEYQLKLKEMNYAEKIKEVTDKFVQELEQAKAKFEILKEERADSEFEYVQRLKQKEEKHQHDMQETETEFQTRIMEEVERYQHLVRTRDAQLERLTIQRDVLVETHEKYVEEFSLDFENKIDEDRQLRLKLEDEKAELLKELNEIQSQLEDDVDSEIENMRYLYDEKLKTSREATLKYKGENGIMRKKFTVLQKEIEDQKEEIKVLFEKEKELHDQVKVLEKEVSAHKREIKNRDVSIGEKEKRIYELKKKNQELDKFKFVLDFKIRELKRQVEPRQAEIAGMKDQIKDMDAELERYHKSNAGLDDMIGTLRGRIDEIQKEIVAKRIKATQLEHLNAGFKGELQRCVSLIQQPDQLLVAMTKLVEEYGSQDAIKPRVDPDVEKEYVRHKQFLLRSVAQLKKSLNEETDKHATMNSDLRNDNMRLINEINKQREANKCLKMNVQANLGRLQHMARVAHGNGKKDKSKNINSGKSAGLQALEAALERGLGDGGGGGGGGGVQETSNDMIETNPLLQLDRNRRRIILLREKISDMEKRMVNNRAYSKEVLPPMDGGMGDTLPPIS
jgi:WD40 repeat protein